MTIQLNRINSDQVKSWQYIETTLIDPNRRLHIMSGIAIPAWEINDDSKIYRDLCEVRLGVTLPDFIQATCQVGLASVSNGESSFLFALDEAWVEPDKTSGELILFVRLALNGEDSSLARFGFQIVALAGNRITGVSGHIRWARSLFDASQFTDGSKLASVTANLVERITPPQGFEFDKLTPLGGNAPGGDVHRDGDDFSMPYSFEHLPLGVPLRFTVNLSAGHFPFDCSPGQTSGPFTVLLTPTHVSESVDFRVSQNNVVR
ncbi:MAG: hypothetical protein QOF62_1710 [Pyrinomonadaceae bacterium]|jgi:hypothetical protein|nr:hypothetical protein [Pyrinomonadaceae bacterium]